MAEKRISTGLIIGAGVAAAGLAGTLIYFATRAWAAPPEGIYCPYCGAGPFANLDEVNAHITEMHPGFPLLIDITWR